MKKICTLLFLLLVGTACTEHDLGETLTPAQEALLGTRVRFEASIAEPFQTRTTYRTDGSFNSGDLMVIYRQYVNGQGYFTETGAYDNYRVYRFTDQTATGTSIILDTQWEVWPGKQGRDDSRGTGSELFTQAASDSLTWDNGKTVRFRAWGLSNLSGALNSALTNKTKSSFYPDFTIAEWATTSGPTHAIPLVLRHLGCRIGFTPYTGNQIKRIEITTDPADYRYEDNSTTLDKDESDKASEAEAATRAAAVAAVYNRMCMPGGVDFEYGLRAMTQTFYADESWNTNATTLEQHTEDMIKFGDKDSTTIRTDAQRPEFHGNNGQFYLISIPHDMSSASTQGNALVLPSYTRFRVYLYDVNNGDKAQTPEEEGGYHIFVLSDVIQLDKDGNIQQDGEDKPIHPFASSGLKLEAGVSYLFRVGYHYNGLTVTSSQQQLSWEQQNEAAATATPPAYNPPTPDRKPYKWWTSAIQTEIEAAMHDAGHPYNPTFEISCVEDFMELIALVNGEAGKPTGEGTPQRLYRDVIEITDEGGQKVKSYRWYTDAALTQPITKEEAEAFGYVFYNLYHPADGDNAAYYEETYLDAPYSFYDNRVKRHFRVELKVDLDLEDRLIDPIGKTETTPFLGILDGGMHTLSHVYVQGGSLFGYAGQAVESSSGLPAILSNLRLQSTHPLNLLARGHAVHLVGLDLHTTAPNGQASLAHALTGASYVVGCLHQGQSGKGLVGSSSGSLHMYGCMETASGITGGALLSSGTLVPQSEPVTWGSFMCNFYDTDRSPGTHAVGSTADAYPLPQYIRGQGSDVLRAVHDNLLYDKQTVNYLLSRGGMGEYYGLAPWKAMNYAIYRYNASGVGQTYPCNAHYTVDESGYNYRYPQLDDGKPNLTQAQKEDWNVLTKLN